MYIHVHVHEICITYNVLLNGNYHGRLICKALNGLHNNVLLGQITISNTRNKRVKSIVHISIIKFLYMQIFMLVLVSVCWS